MNNQKLLFSRILAIFLIAISFTTFPSSYVLAQNEGDTRYNSSLSIMQFHNGSIWRSVRSPVCPTSCSTYGLPTVAGATSQYNNSFSTFCNGSGGCVISAGNGASCSTPGAVRWNSTTKVHEYCASSDGMWERWAYPFRDYYCNNGSWQGQSTYGTTTDACGSAYNHGTTITCSMQTGPEGQCRGQYRQYTCQSDGNWSSPSGYYTSASGNCSSTGSYTNGNTVRCASTPHPDGCDAGPTPSNTIYTCSLGDTWVGGSSCTLGSFSCTDPSADGSFGEQRCCSSPPVACCNDGSGTQPLCFPAE